MPFYYKMYQSQEIYQERLLTNNEGPNKSNT